MDPHENWFAGKRVLITGGAGFIGSHLARRLVHLQAEVMLLDSMIPEYGGNLWNVQDLREHLTLNFADLRDPHTLPYLVSGQDLLFNLAGQTSHLDSMVDPFTDLEINARAQISLLEACRLHNPDIRIVFASTRQIYGKPLSLPVPESHPIQPTDINGIHKAAGERYHLLYHEVHGLACSALRLTNTIGPGMRIRDARQTFLGTWIRCLLEDRPIEVWGGHQIRDFTDVQDAVEAFLLVSRLPAAIGQVYNLGGNEPLSLEQLARLCCELYGSGSFRLCPFPEERKKIDIGDYVADDSRIRKELGWRPVVTLRESLLRILTFYRAHAAHYLNFMEASGKNA